MAFYEPMRPDLIADWIQYRQAYAAHFHAAAELAKTQGAIRFSTGFDGSLHFIAPAEGVTLPPFWACRRGDDFFYLKDKAPAKKWADALGQIHEGNRKLRALFPDAEAIARAHGFITNVSYQSESGTGSLGIGNVLTRIQPCWTRNCKAAILYAPDGADGIRYAREKMGAITTTPESWSIPEGYREISRAKWDYMLAKSKLDAELTGEEAA